LIAFFPVSIGKKVLAGTDTTSSARDYLCCWHGRPFMPDCCTVVCPTRDWGSPGAKLVSNHERLRLDRMHTTSYSNLVETDAILYRFRDIIDYFPKAKEVT